MKVRLEYFNTFGEVVKEGSLFGAAKSLGMSVSTISLHVDSVEKFFGAKLLDKDVKGVKLTRAGELAHKNIKEVLEHVDKARNSIKNLKTRNIIIAMDCVGIPIISEIQRKYKKEHPDVHIATKVTGEYECLKLLEKGEVNLVLAGYTSPPRLGDKYHVEKMGDDMFILIVPTDHELARKEVVNTEDVLSHPIVTISEDYGCDGLEDALKSVGRSGEEHKIECSVNDIFSQIYGVSAGLGTAVTSYILSRKYEEGGLIKIRKINDFIEKRPVYTICSEMTLENPLIRNFYEFLVEEGRELLDKWGVDRYE